ncbi:MAG: Na/Pi cotransporter family protein, partial [Pirellulales bacterium]|nr:Na/Pi cotransporter family protein [Pirellulales bacterium]
MLFASTDAQLDVFGIVIGLLGGLGLFLYGMHKMSDGLKAVAGNGMKTLLAKLTTNRFMAAITGAVVTAVLQSSSITTVLVIGFVSAGLMTLSQTIGVIMGANLGTTITAQMLAFNITELAWAMVALGFAGWSFSKTDNARNVGTMLMGFGMLFIGMAQMGDATGPLRTFEPFIEVMSQMDNVLLAILIGAVFTALVQSSSATIGIVIMLASQGYLSLPAGISLAIGAKIGTCVTAILAGLGKPARARQVGLVHVMFNVLGALLWLPFIDQLAAIAQAISPVSDHLQGVERLAADTPRQVANAITVFAAVNLCVMIWFTGPIAKLVQWMVPERPEEEQVRAEPKYLDESYLGTPSLGLDQVRMELGHMGDYVLKMMHEAPVAIVEGSEDDLRRVEEMDDDVDVLYAAILEYVRSLARSELTTTEADNLEDWLSVADHLESTADLIETNLVEQGRRRLNKQLNFSEQTREVIAPLYEAVAGAMEDALQAVKDKDAHLARQIVARKSEIQELADRASAQLSQRLLADEPDRVAVFRVESDIISQLNRLFYFARR